MYINETHSTSTLLREMYSDALPHLYTVRAGYQTAGRGQAGNSWESEKDKNLLFSSLLRYPLLPAAEQWRLSMLVAVTIREAIAQCLTTDSSCQPLTIKWPNDIYYGDKKLVGILIENSLDGKNIGYSIAGVGVNVNQTQWLSPAPNPISMKQITGKEYRAEEVLDQWITSMKAWEKRSTEEIKSAYMQHLYRQKGWHRYVEREVSTAPTAIATQDAEGIFLAQVVDVSQQGELILRTKDEQEKTYHFKQIRFVL